MVHLRNSVKERFTELMAGVTNADLQRHSKVVVFRDSVRKYAMQGEELTPSCNLTRPLYFPRYK